MNEPKPFQALTPLQNLALFKTLFCTGLTLQIAYSLARQSRYVLIREPDYTCLVAGFSWLPVPALSHTGTTIAGLTMIALLAAAVWGRWTRWALLGATGAYFLYFGQILFLGDILQKTNIIPFILAILAAAPGVDRAHWRTLLKAHGDPGSAQSDSVLQWPLTLIKAMTILTLFATAKAKLINSGFAWMEGETFKHVLIEHHLCHDLPLGYWLAQQDNLLPVLCWMVIFLESLGLLALVSRRFGILWALSAVTFHIACVPTLGIYYTKYFCLGYLVFLDMELVETMKGFLRPPHKAPVNEPAAN